jgi:hypothetical protein
MTVMQRAKHYQYVSLFPKGYLNQGETMKSLRTKCIDCGSEAIETLIDEIKPNFRMEVVRYACGAEFRGSFSTTSNMGKAIHSGCMQG